MVDLNYFGAYHGHSEIDAHFGCGKRKLRINAGDGPVFSKAQIEKALSELPNTTVLNIDPPALDLKVKSFEEQIRKWFQWLFTQWF